MAMETLKAVHVPGFYQKKQSYCPDSSREGRKKHDNYKFISPTIIPMEIQEKKTLKLSI